MTRERDTEVLRDSVELQGRVAFERVDDGAADAEVQAPAVEAVVEALAQQEQLAQPSVCRAEAAQQQPPRHRLVPQSAAEAQASPGELSRQVPDPKEQAAQPCFAAFTEQHTSPLHTPEAQESPVAQAAPGFVSGLQEAAPGGENVPALHGVQLEAPAAALNVFAGQEMGEAPAPPQGQ